MKKKYILGMTTFLILISTALAGCIDEDAGKYADEDRVTEELVEEYEVDSGTAIQVDLKNGGVKITTHDGEKVELHIEKSVPESLEDKLDDIEVDVINKNNELTITTDYKNDFKYGSVHIEIKAPEDVVVEKVEVSNGNIDIEGVNGDMTLESSNGNINVKNVSGSVKATTSNGNIELTQVEEVLNTATTNGNILVQITKLNKDIKIKTANGNINVFIDPSLDADITAETTNGKVTINDLDIDLSKDKRTEKAGKLGKGGNKITITTSNSNIDIHELD